MKIKNQLKQIPGSWYFLISIIIIYLFLLILKREFFSSSLDFFYNIILKVIPIFIFVFILMVLTNYFITPKFIMKHFKKRGIKKWFFVVIGGILSTGPIYMWYPLLADLKNKGFVFQRL